MKNVVIIGAGKIGGAIARMLAETGDYQVTVADRSADQLAKLDAHAAVTTTVVDITDSAALDALLAEKFAVLSAAPFHLTGAIAESAARTAHPLSRPDRGCCLHPRGQAHCRHGQVRLHSAMRPCPGLHLHRRP